MRRIESDQDRMEGYVTFEVSAQQYVRLDARDVARYGVAELARSLGLQVPTERVPVMRRGERIGSVPGDFDPCSINSRSLLYEPRQGDFIRERDYWIASNSLGSGDLESVPGFIWDRG